MVKLREDFSEPMNDCNEVYVAGEELMDYIVSLTLPTLVHNRLVNLVEQYREQAEQSAYAKGAIEKPRVEERTGNRVTIHNP